MKNALFIFIVIIMLFACNTTKKASSSNEALQQTQVGDTIKISGDNQEYDVIIIEPGFGTYLASRAQPKGYYTQNYMESRNIRYVQEWNRRVLEPRRYNPNLYEMEINYRQGVDYGYDVNYKIYNYFIYFQNTYNQNLLGTRVPQN
ncbi:hypothetical protein CLV86_0194 [Lacinutrix venerupis]|uniref:Lipoprotein n=1 Tax=Lacinutrix venerupis TaxID=1486034 RepID=A0AAC9PW30_9FLAO|nr:DUF6146 family protein [Lacinutrix venerupis]APY00367.1 hypothetical protein BWR22_08570 [Lacinutrix venerupis]RLJ68805.1 hypothetical protein CLV86_0194 [Lacinutrix venerupis]